MTEPRCIHGVSLKVVCPDCRYQAPGSRLVYDESRRPDPTRYTEARKLGKPSGGI